MASTATVPAIEYVHVLSTGSGYIHKEHREGSRLPQIVWVLASQRWIEVPVNVYVIKHRAGLVLFDTGLDSAIVTDPNYVNSVIGRFFMRRLFRLSHGPVETLTGGLAGLGYAAADVRKAVISHLHFDHVGGIAKIPQAELLVSRNEWRQLSGPHPERDFILREHIELPQAKWRQIDFAPCGDPLLAPFGGCYDVMGDGSMLLLPTPGHTPGSLSMLVRTGDAPPLLLAGDLAYGVDLLMKDQLPGTGDPAQLRSSYAKVRNLKKQLPGLVVLPSHDPDAADALRAWASQRESARQPISRRQKPPGQSTRSTAR